MVAEKQTPGALAGATGEKIPCYALATDSFPISNDAQRRKSFPHGLAPLAATLDPSTLAALGLAGARIWGAVA